MNHAIDYLFIPVSSLHGVGEYTRSLIIAQELQTRSIDAKIAFVLNRHSPVVTGCPFPVFLVDDTPTKCNNAVNAIVLAQRPRVVIFDASGRVSQFKMAKKIHAYTVFISQHAKKRKKGLQLRRAIYTDAHYVVQPEFALPPLSFYQRLKLRLATCAIPQCIGPIFKLPQPDFIAQTLNALNVSHDGFILFNAGSGGHKVGEQLASDIFLAAAERIAQTIALPCLVIMGTNYPKALPCSSVCHIVEHVNTLQFAALLQAAKCVVLSGGSGFLQAAILSKPTIVTAISSDQPERIAACKKIGFGYEAKTSPDTIAEAVLSVVNDLNSPSSAPPKSIAINNGLDVIVKSLLAAVNVKEGQS